MIKINVGFLSFGHELVVRGAFYFVQFVHPFYRLTPIYISHCFMTFYSGQIY